MPQAVPAADTFICNTLWMAEGLKRVPGDKEEERKKEKGVEGKDDSFRSLKSEPVGGREKKIAQIETF